MISRKCKANNDLNTSSRSNAFNASSNGLALPAINALQKKDAGQHISNFQTESQSYLGSLVQCMPAPVVQRVITINSDPKTLPEAKRYLTEEEDISEDTLPLWEQAIAEVNRENMSFDSWNKLILELINRSRGFDLRDQMIDMMDEGIT